MNTRMNGFGNVMAVDIMWMTQVRMLTPDAIKIVAQSNTNIRKCMLCIILPNVVALTVSASPRV